MSTHLYLQCESHIPPITSWDESGQHLSDLEQIREDLANRYLIAQAMQIDFVPDNIFGHYRSNTARFISQHPHCEISIIDEHTRRHPLTDEEE